ncbi:hypothetical protein R8Z57_12295 [Microbacterium sp. M3]|uniref:Uncharacterized protein n=1 Tax=Microbacterium arthrosphaerae TaxID=792652 RepID=A0ABU4H2Q0_9MICO|nr:MULTISPECIES: hypothetical protein [Microbacterium]MDW4573555.1 hypothetical protein [Microbacterium arthrosphaerae]MDW7607410.1 hypothetical protein [Microbacterium sp. M3]
MSLSFKPQNWLAAMREALSSLFSPPVHRAGPRRRRATWRATLADHRRGGDHRPPSG